ncbi:MAG: SCP2 sterol-binding domain-containing protein, partial [Deltaproteobacteria bacterium]|nr:SCP2 sterol-binding domain-containing protein [Deltaproteobacteria bacterium]
ETGETRVIDGVEIVFQMTPDTEAVAEFVFYLPQYRALCMSEITSHHLHNVYTPRGAQIRDALAWSNQINESITLFGDKLEVQFGSHHWPIWGREEVIEYLKQQRDLYKYIHDQTLRLANHGFTKEEIAEQLRLPASLARNFSNREYYGTVSHNAKGVYCKYLGWFDGNPATLNPLPPKDAAKRYVNYMGGAEAVITQARKSFDQGEYRWVAQVMNHVVLSDPGHTPARTLLADTYEQLGYQAESGPWRNFYLSGAFELRHGLPAGSAAKMSKGMVQGVPLENVFQALAVRLNGPKAEGKRLAFNLDFTDLEQPYLMTMENVVLNAFRNRQDSNPTAKLKLSSLDFKYLMTGLMTAADLISEGRLAVEGDLAMLLEFAGLFDQFNPFFPIVTPRERSATTPPASQAKTIYFIHSTGFDFNKEYYAPLRDSDLSEIHTLIFPHANSDEPFSSKEFFESGRCDLVVAEVSYPSTGMGIELGWAIAYGIPIILVARHDVNLSKSIKSLGVPLLWYKNSADLVEKLGEELNNFDITS